MQNNALLNVLPPFERKRDVIVFGDQSIEQIIAEVLNAHYRYASHYDTIAGMFTGYAPKKLFEFCQRYIPYKEESGKDQNTKSPAAMLQSRNSDCKHYAGFIGGVLDAINRSGKFYYDWSYRFASYESKDDFDHVFVVVGDNLWIDPTPIRNKETGMYTSRTFNDRIIYPLHSVDLKPATMLSSIHGVHYIIDDVQARQGGKCCNGIGDVTTPQTGTSQTTVSPAIQAAAASDPEVAAAVEGAQQLASQLPDGSLKDWVNDFLSDPTGAVESIIFGRKYNIGNYKLGEVYMRNILGMEQIQRNTQVKDPYVPQAWAFFTAALGIPIGSIDHLDQLVISRDAYKSWANATFKWVPDDQVNRAHTIMNQYIGWTPTYYPRDIAWDLNKFQAIAYIYPIWAVWPGDGQPQKFTGKHPITGQTFSAGFPSSASSPAGGAPGGVPTSLAGFSTMEILIFLGLAGGLLYAANKKQKHG